MAMFNNFIYPLHINKNMKNYEVARELMWTSYSSTKAFLLANGIFEEKVIILSYLKTISKNNALISLKGNDNFIGDAISIINNYKSKLFRKEYELNYDIKKNIIFVLTALYINNLYTHNNFIHLWVNNNNICCLILISIDFKSSTCLKITQLLRQDSTMHYTKDLKKSIDNLLSILYKKNNNISIKKCAQLCVLTEQEHYKKHERIRQKKKRKYVKRNMFCKKQKLKN